MKKQYNSNIAKKFFLLLLLFSIIEIEAQTGTGLNLLGENPTYDYIEVSHSSSIDFTTSFTYETWVKFDDLSRLSPGLYSWQSLLGKDDFLDSYGLMIQNSTKTLRFYHTGFSNGFTDYSWTGVSAVSVDTWYHIAITFDGTKVAIYIDGTEVVSRTATAGSLTTNTYNLRIGGGSDFAYPLQGTLDEVRLWNVARTATQISDYRSYELEGNEPGLVLYYNFNQGTAGGDNTAITTVTDGSSSGNNGTLNQFALNGSTSNFISDTGHGVQQKQNQTVTFNALPSKTYGDADFNVSASSDSGLTTFTYSSSNTNVATVSGNTITLTGGGTTTITAHQAGNNVYNSASAPQTLTVTANDWSGGTTGDWNTGGNWSMGVPTTSLSINIPSGTVITASSQADVNGLTIPNNSAFNSTANINNVSPITIQSIAANSGVLIAPSLNNNTVVYERGGFTANTWSLVSAPVSGQKIKDFVENSANDIRINTTVTPNRYAVGYYDDTRAVGTKWVYYDLDFLTANPNIEFEAGRSYAMSRATDGVVTFTGTTPLANVPKTVTASEWNAIGNPFSAFVSATSGGVAGANFINDNSAIFDPTNVAIYVWDAAQARYVARSLTDPTETSIAPGKGFFIRTTSGVSSTNFNIDKRTIQPSSGNTSFNRNTPMPSIQLKATLNDLTIDTNIRYFDNVTKGLDPGYDVAAFGGNNFELYTKLLKDYEDIDFTIQSLPKDNYENLVIPVGLKASSGDQITFTAEVLNLPTSIDVYLEDREQNTFEKLSADSAMYKVTLSQDINGVGRFYIHTVANVPTTELDGINIFTTEQRNLRITGVKNEQGTVVLFNILGEQIFNESFKGRGSNDFSLPNFNPGIYIVNLQTEKGKLNKKIVIE